MSRVHLAGRLDVSRTTIAAEVSRLAELGLAQEVGHAASRGGRRSTLVDLADDIRFVGIAIGATGLSVGVTDGRVAVLATRSIDCDIRKGPEPVLATALSEARALIDELGIDRPMGAGIAVPGPVDFHRGVPVSPPIMPGWDGYPVRDALSRELGCPAVLDNDVNGMALGEQHAGVREVAPGLPLRQDRHRDRLRHRRRRRALPGRRRVRRRHRAHPRRGVRPHLRLWQHRLSGGVLGWRGAGPRRDGGRALRPLPGPGGDAGAEGRADRRRRRARCRRKAMPTRCSWYATAVAGSDRCSPAWCRSSTPGSSSSAAGSRGVGHSLLAEIRGVTYRRSLPLATGNLPIVLSELGDESGVIGAARLISSSVYAPLEEPAHDRTDPRRRDRLLHPVLQGGRPRRRQRRAACARARRRTPTAPRSTPPRGGRRSRRRPIRPAGSTT